ncbi:Hypothetical predicted protein, partial [Mytilus galloprovincialis]
SNIDDSSAMLPEELKTISDDISYIELTVTVVEDILKIVNPTKASGPDFISPKLLKEASSVLKYPLCKLFNLSLSTSTFPDEWKRANVTPVYKNSKPNDVKNYRPISLLSVISKCMERSVYKHVYNHYMRHYILTKNQSGFQRLIN